MNRGGFTCDHDCRIGRILDTNLGRIVNVSPNTEKELMKIEMHQLRNELNALIIKSQQLDERLLDLERRFNS